MKRAISILWSVLLVGSVLGADAQDGAVVAAQQDPPGPVVKAPEPRPISLLPFSIGFDVYHGISNQAGRHHYSDGIWAGAGNYFPSVAYLRWKGSHDQSIKVSLGTGGLITGSGSTLDQPVEAYWQAPLGAGTMTVGKFWVPFAQQEWVYETKPGAMWQWSGAHSSLSLSANYNTLIHTPNAYMRVGYRVAPDAEVGLSIGGGRGFSSNSPHDRGLAVDTTLGYAGWRLFGEYNLFGAAHRGNTFDYVSGKLSYERLGRWKPYVAVYAWNDQSGAFGRFRCTIYGLNYQLTPAMTLEAASAATSDHHMNWLQVHWTWER